MIIPVKRNINDLQKLYINALSRISLLSLSAQIVSLFLVLQEEDDRVHEKYCRLSARISG